MRKFIFTALLTASIGITTALAQDAATAPRQIPSPEERAKQNTEMLTKRLSLSDDQKAKVYAITLEAATKRSEMIKANPADREAFREEMKKSSEEVGKKLNEVFTEEQRKAYAQWREEQKARMQNGGKNRSN